MRKTPLNVMMCKIDILLCSLFHLPLSSLGNEDYMLLYEQCKCFLNYIPSLPESKGDFSNAKRIKKIFLKERV